MALRRFFLLCEKKNWIQRWTSMPLWKNNNPHCFSTPIEYKCRKLVPCHCWFPILIQFMWLYSVAIRIEQSNILLSFFYFFFFTMLSHLLSNQKFNLDSCLKVPSVLFVVCLLKSSFTVSMSDFFVSSFVLDFCVQMF